MPKPVRKVGRPSKPAGERKRNNLTLRIRDKLRSDLARSADHHQRSLSEEAEARLEHSFDREDLFERFAKDLGGKGLYGLVKVIAAAMGEAGRAAGNLSGVDSDKWTSDPYAYDEALQAVVRVLEVFRPFGEIVVPPVRIGPTGTRLGRGLASGIVDDIARGRARAGGASHETVASELRASLEAELKARLSANAAGKEVLVYRVEQDVGPDVYFTLHDTPPEEQS